MTQFIPRMSVLIVFQASRNSCRGAEPHLITQDTGLIICDPLRATATTDRLLHLVVEDSLIILRQDYMPGITS